MISNLTPEISNRPALPRALLRFLSVVGGLLVLAGCSSVSRRAPGRTVVDVAATTVPARVLSNFFLVESRWEDGRTYRFLVDTGSTVSYVSPELAKRFAVKPKKGDARKLLVRSASGGEVELEAITLRRLSLGDSHFDRVEALVLNLDDMSNTLGVAIDGIIGFPVFRNTLLTMDYPNSRMIIAPYPAAFAPPPRQTPQVSTLSFNNQQGTPLIPVQLGNESFIVLVDSGSDRALSLNSAGLHPRFANGPRIGPVISSLQGDRQQLTGRLDQSLLIGAHTVEQPIVDLTDQLSSIGGEVLRYFAVTFDQRRNQVTFTHNQEGPITMEPRRHTGLSFTRLPIYWRVLAVIPDTPAATLPLQAGDLCVRINGEPVAKWDATRYAELVRTAAKVTYTFLIGAKETDIEVPVFDLVP